MSKDPIKLMEGCMGSTIERLQIDLDNEVIQMTLNNGVIRFEGDGLEMIINLEELDS